MGASHSSWVAMSGQEQRGRFLPRVSFLDLQFSRDERGGDAGSQGDHDLGGADHVP
jgi:hypothetical protein